MKWKSFSKVYLVPDTFSIFTPSITHSILGQKQPTPKVLPHSIPGVPSIGMGIYELGKVEFLKYGLPLLSYASLKGPE